MPYTLNQIRELLGKITPGEWNQGRWDDPSFMSVDGIVAGEDRKRVIVTACNCEAGSCNEDDAIFITAAPSIISQLLEERETLEMNIRGMQIEGRALEAIKKDEWGRIKMDHIPECFAYNEALDDVLALFQE